MTLQSQAISASSEKSIVLSTSPAVDLVWEWGTCTSFSPRYSLHFFLSMRRGGAAAVQTVWDLQSQAFSGFGRTAAGRAQECAQGSAQRLDCARASEISTSQHTLLCVLFSADAKSMGTRTGTNSYYFLLIFVSQRNVQLVELLISASMVMSGGSKCTLLNFRLAKELYFMLCFSCKKIQTIYQKESFSVPFYPLAFSHLTLFSSLVSHKISFGQWQHS